MMKKFPSFYSDQLFWNSAKALVKALTPLPDLEIIMQPMSYKRNSKSYARLMADPYYPSATLETKMFLAAVFNALNRSPNLFIPYKKFVFLYAPNASPAIIGRKELFTQFCQLCTGFPEIFAYLATIKDKILKVLGEDDLNNIEEDNESYCPINPCVSVTGIRGLVNEFYRYFYKYVKNHYDRTRLGVTTEEKFFFSVGLLQALRDYKQRGFPYSCPLDFSIFALEDDTLYIRQLDETKVINAASLSQVFGVSQWNLPLSLHAEAENLLKKYQELLLHRRKQNPPEYPLEGDVSTYSFSSFKVQIHCDKTTKFLSKGSDQSSPQEIEFLKEEIEKVGIILFLYEITGGSIVNLRDLSRSFLYALCDQKLFPGVIYFPFELQNTILPLLSNGSAPPYPLSYFAKKESIDALIQHKLNHVQTICCEDDLTRLNEDQQKWLNKVLRGKTVSKKDAVLGRKKHTCTAQFIVFGNDLTPGKLKKIGVPILAPKLNTTAVPITRSMISFWFNTMLPLWSLIHLEDKSIVAEAPPMARTVERFINQCCILYPDDPVQQSRHFVEAKLLYEQYRSFCGKTGQTGKLKFKDFNKELEQNFHLTRKQRHMKTNESPTVFYGIQLREDTPQLDLNDEKNYHKIDDFVKQFLSLRQEILDYFPDLPVTWKDILHNGL